MTLNLLSDACPHQDLLKLMASDDTLQQYLKFHARVDSEVAAVAQILQVKLQLGQKVDPLMQHASGITELRDEQSPVQMYQQFRNMIMSDVEVANAVEGMTYATLRSQVKELLADDEELTIKLIKCAAEGENKLVLTYGVLAVMSNVVQFKRKLTDEE